MRVLIGVPCGRLEPRGWQEVALVRLLTSATQQGFQVPCPAVEHGACVAKNRNRLLALAEELGMDACLLLDSDVIPPAETIERLAALNVPVASGVYFMHSAPHLPLVFRTLGYQGNTPRYAPVTELPDEPFPADAVGGGCLLLRREVWLKLAPRPFTMIYDEQDSLGEDFSFCARATAHFGPVWVDPDVSCGHMTLVPVGRSHFDAGVARVRAELGARELLFSPDGQLLEAPACLS